MYVCVFVYVHVVRVCMHKCVIHVYSSVSLHILLCFVFTMYPGTQAGPELIDHTDLELTKIYPSQRPGCWD